MVKRGVSEKIVEGDLSMPWRGKWLMLGGNENYIQNAACYRARRQNSSKSSRRGTSLQDYIVGFVIITAVPDFRPQQLVQPLARWMLQLDNHLPI